MAALREIFARFGVAFDSGPLARGEAQIQKVTSALGTFGLAVGGAAIVAGVRSFVNDIRDAGDELGDTSTRLGVTTDQLQAWRHAAELSGSSGEALTDALDKMQRTLGEAAGGSQEARDALRRLGIDAQNAEGSVRGVGEVIPELAESLSRMASPAERTAALTKVMGRAAGELGPLFAQGSEGVAAMAAEYQRLGGGLSEDAIQAASDLADAQLRLDAALLGVKSRIGVVILPILERLANAFTGLVSNSRKMEALAITLGAVAAVVTVKLLPALAALAVRSQAILAQWAPLIVLGGILYLVIEDIKTALDGGDSLFGQWTDAINDFIEANESADGVLGAVSRTWRGLLDMAERGIAIFDSIIHADPSRLVAFDEARRNAAAPQRRGFGSFGVTAGGAAVPLGGARAVAARAGGGTGNASGITINNVQQITGDSPAEIARAVRRENERTNRRALEALEDRAE